MRLFDNGGHRAPNSADGARDKPSSHRHQRRTRHIFHEPGCLGVVPLSYSHLYRVRDLRTGDAPKSAYVRISRTDTSRVQIARLVGAGLKSKVQRMDLMDSGMGDLELFHHFVEDLDGRAEVVRGSEAPIQAVSDGVQIDLAVHGKVCTF